MQTHIIQIEITEGVWRDYSTVFADRIVSRVLKAKAQSDFPRHRLRLVEVIPDEQPQYGPKYNYEDQGKNSTGPG